MLRFAYDVTVQNTIEVDAIDTATAQAHLRARAENKAMTVLDISEPVDTESGNLDGKILDSEGSPW